MGRGRGQSARGAATQTPRGATGALVAGARVRASEQTKQREQATEWAQRLVEQWWGLSRAELAEMVYRTEDRQPTHTERVAHGSAYDMELLGASPAERRAAVWVRTLLADNIEEGLLPGETSDDDRDHEWVAQQLASADWLALVRRWRAQALDLSPADEAYAAEHWESDVRFAVAQARADAAAAATTRATLGQSLHRRRSPLAARAGQCLPEHDRQRGWRRRRRGGGRWRTARDGRRGARA